MIPPPKKSVIMEIKPQKVQMFTIVHFLKIPEVLHCYSFTHKHLCWHYYVLTASYKIRDVPSHLQNYVAR